MHKKDCTCQQPTGSAFWGEGFSRRRFLRIAGTGIVMSYFADVANASLLERVSAVGPSLQRSARNTIFIFLSGGMSQTDTVDLKEGTWTPADFAPTSYGEIRWPQGLLPNLATHLDKLAIVRSGLAWAAVHPLAQKWAQIARNPSGATGGIAPHIGAVISLESQLKRAKSDVLPGFVALGQVMATSGYLSAQHSPFAVTASPNGLTALAHPDGAARLSDRWQLLQSTDDVRTNGALGGGAADMASFYDQAKLLIDTPDINRVFSYTNDERTRYGSTGLGDNLLVARNVLAANLGTRFVQVTHGGWDHHSNIYAKQGQSIYTNGKQLDVALGALLTDLAAMPGVAPGKRLLDETLVVVLGEFGRTPGVVTGNGGRDHYLRMSLMFAGGGIKGGRVIGSTDTTGAAVKEFGWGANRDVRPEDVTSTIYSSMGIDYTTVRKDDPLGRGFEYVPFAKEGTYRAIDELF